MKYLMGKTKVIHFELPELKKGVFQKVTNNPVINIYERNGDKTPFMIQWRFRFEEIDTGKEMTGSYLAESNFSLQDNGEVDFDKLKELIVNLYMNVTIHWQDLCKGTIIDSSPLPVMNDSALQSISEKIVEMLD